MTKADRNLRIIFHTPAAQEYIKYFIQNGTACEMSDIRDAECSKKFTFDPFEKDVGGINFKPNEELCQHINAGLGVVQLSKKADPKMSSLKVESELLEAMKKAKLTVELKTSKEKVAHESLDDVVIKITPQDDVKVEEKQIISDGEVTVNFSACVSGRFTADVRVRGIPVTNSPLVMDVKPQQIVGIAGNPKLMNGLNTGSKNFTGIAVNKANSMIAVVDYLSSCVRVFSMEGDLLWLTYGGKDKFKQPYGLSFLTETDLIIADNGNHRICIFNTYTGEMVKTFGCQGNGDGQLNHPCGVHVDDDSRIIVSEHGNQRVQIFTKDGEYQCQFSVANTNPLGLVIHNGLFYVTDYSNSVVNVIEFKDNESPTTITTIGNGRLLKPYGLAIDYDNNLLVCDDDSTCKSVHKFTLDGRYVGKTGVLSQSPSYITVLNNGHAICTTSGAGCFQFKKNE